MQETFRKDEQKPQGLGPGWAGGGTGRRPPLISQGHTLHAPFATNKQQPGGRENSKSLTVGVGGGQDPA